jgi:amidase
VSEDPVAQAAELGALRVGPELLATGSLDGPLADVAIVVKDLIDVAGVPTGAGHPDYLAGAEPATAHAPAVARLLGAGARVMGKAHTDELAFSLSGTNIHYGTPQNPRAPDRIPGGSSSGSASAVAGGLVPLALGTDTGGSIRVPASYCGIFGLRPTHGRVPLRGVVELAPSFDTVGLLAASGHHLKLGGEALLASSGVVAPPDSLIVVDDLLVEADPAVAAAVVGATEILAAHLGIPCRSGLLTGGRLSDWFAAFRGRQMVEAWQSHGAWIERCRPRLGPGVAGRFDLARQTPTGDARAAVVEGQRVRHAVDQLLPGRAVLVLPSTATVAPPLDLGGGAKDDLRLRTMRLTCVAGLGGLPAVSLPLASVDGRPVGVCLVGRPGDDELLLAAADTGAIPGVVAATAPGSRTG